MTNLKEWIEEGYLVTAVWKRLQNLITPDILPSFTERSELRQQSLSSENLPIGFSPYTSGSTKSTTAGTSMQDNQSTDSSFSSGISTGIGDQS